jgi:hypothetical protein
VRAPKGGAEDSSSDEPTPDPMLLVASMLAMVGFVMKVRRAGGTRLVDTVTCAGCAPRASHSLLQPPPVPAPAPARHCRLSYARPRRPQLELASLGSLLLAVSAFFRRGADFDVKSFTMALMFSLTGIITTVMAEAARKSMPGAAPAAAPGGAS